MIHFREGQRLAILGSGDVGQNMHRELRRLFGDRLGLLIADSNPSRVGRELFGGTVMSAESLSPENLDALILGFRTDAETYDQMRSALSGRFTCPILSATEVFAAYPGVRGWPILDAAEAAQALPLASFAAGKMADEESRRQYLAYYEWVCRTEGAAPPAGDGSDQYFQEQIVAIRHQEVFVDCGAFTGDTLMTFLKRSDEHFQEYYAFEPDVVNFSSLAARTACLPAAVRTRIRLFNSAVGGVSGYLNFAASASQTSRIAEGTENWVPVQALADVRFRTRPTFIKLDLEGADFHALCGLLAHVMEWRPVLCIAIYHNPRDFIDIPMLLMTALDGYSFFVRAHNDFGLDFVLYCIPRERAVHASLSSPASRPTNERPTHGATDH